MTKPTWTRRSMCMNVEGFMRSNRYPRGYDIFQDDDGHIVFVLGPVAV